MKRTGHLIEKIADPDNLRLAFWKARKGKSHSKAVESYRVDLDNNLCLLRSQILTAQVVVGDYHYFKIFEPKEREICASSFDEQVLHHALMNICHFYFERKQIYDSYASRKNKGTYAALERAKGYSRRYDFYLKLDIKKYFASIKPTIINHQLVHLFKDQRLLKIFCAIIKSYPYSGLPIGNLTSQYFANHYLSGLDHFIKEQLSCKAYVRYMDDMVLWHNDKRVLKAFLLEIDIYLKKHLQLKLKYNFLQPTKKGLPFLGYVIFPYFVRLKQQSKQRFISKTKFLMQQCQQGKIDEAEYQRKVLPLLAFTMHADTLALRQKLFSFRE